MANILMVAAENDTLPNGKVGGIGDVIRDIPNSLASENQQVSVITPSYGYQSSFEYAEHITDFSVVFGGKLETVQLFQLHIDLESGVRQFVLEHPFFSQAGIGQIYCDDGASRPFASDATKFAFFSTAICELLLNQWHEQFNVIHLHDWHSAFIAIHCRLNIRYQKLKALRFVYTIHNLALQGIRPIKGDESSFETWFPGLDIDYHLIVDPSYRNCINPARAGINLADAVHVVSPSYAAEVVKASEPSLGFIGGEGLEHDLQNALAEKRLSGILNGCQYDVAIPEKMPFNTFVSFMKEVVMQWAAKTANITSAHFIAIERLNLWLNDDKFSGPLVTSVGRLTTQKVTLLVECVEQEPALSKLLKRIETCGGKLIILGSGDPALELKMTALMAKHQHFVFLNGYHDGLSQQIYSQGDLFLMPSSFEPCGISQMLSMRAGQPCLVHNIGGLKDTVKHLDTGFIFSGHDKKQQIQNMQDELSHALQLFKQDKVKWQAIKAQAKAQRFTWPKSIRLYIAKLYETE